MRLDVGRWLRGALGALGALVAATATAQPWSLVLSPDAARPTLQSIAVMPDGGILGGGALGTDPWLVRVDASGALAWQARFAYDGTAESSVVSVVARPDGGAVALLLHAWSVSRVGDSEPVLAFVDPAGAVTRSVAWSIGVESVPFALDVAPDGSSFSLVERAGDGAVFVSRRDAAGDPLWTKELTGVITPWRAGALRAMPDGGFVVMLPTRADPSGIVPWIGRADADGILAWEGQWATPALYRMALAPRGDGSVLAVVHAGVPGAEASAQLFDPAGLPTWQRSYALGNGGAPISADVAGDGSFAVLGSTMSDGAAMLRLDADGTPAWLRGIGEGAFSSANGVRGGVRFRAGDLVMAGSWTSAPDAGTAVVAQLDDVGNSGGCLASAALAATSWQAQPDLRVVGATFVDASSTEAPGPLLPVPTSEAPECLLDCAADAQEPDDGCASASEAGAAPLVLGGSFCNDADDWTRLTTCAGETVTIETDLLGRLADTQLELFAADCTTLLAFDDDSGPGLGSRASYTAPRAGGLIVHVRQADGTSGPERGYRLSASVSPAPGSSFFERLELRRDFGTRTASGRPGGGIVLGGGTTLEGWAAAVSAGGSVDWALTTSGAHEGRLVAAAGADGGALLAGDSPTATDPKRYRRVDAAGATLWQTSLPVVDRRPVATAGAGLPDGSFVVVGLLDQGAPSDGWALRFDASGNVLWERVLTPGFGGWATCVDTLADGTAFVGVVSGRSGEGGHVHRVSPSGDLVWSREIARGGYPTGDMRLAATPDGGLVLAVPANGADVVVARLDANGDLLWEQGLRVGSWTALASIAATADGGILLALDVVEPPPSSLQTGLIVRFRAGGALAWARQPGGGSFVQEGSHAVAVQELPGGDVLACAELYHDGVGDLVVTRMDSGGRLDVPCPGFQSARVEVSPARVEVTELLAAVEVRSPSTLASSSPTRTLGVAVAAACSCDCGMLSPPGEVSGAGATTFLRVDGAGLLTWEGSLASGACRFNLYRGDLFQLRGGDSGSCLQAHLATNDAVDLELPPPGAAWFYLVTGESDAEGTSGSTSLGAPRPNVAPCP